MSNEHPSSQPVTPVDSGSQALAEALHSSFGIVKFVMGALFVVFLFSGFFTVGPQEKAIKLRFGKPVGEGEQALLGSGAHWAWPYPIDEVIKIPITEIQEVKARVNWFAQTSLQEARGEIPPAPFGTPMNPAIDGYALTGDGNIVHVKATLRYRIEDPVRCVFEFALGTNQDYSLAGISNAVQNVLENALVRTSAGFKMDDTLFDKIAFQDAVQRHVVKLVQEQKLGLLVDQCVVETRQPRQLDDAFKRVTDAGQRRSTAITEANTYRNQVLSRADADAVSAVDTAQTEKTFMVDRLTTDAASFRKLLPAYRSNPTLFKQVRLVETMGRVFTNVQDKMYLPTTADGKPIELRLLLNRELPKPKPETKTP
ncbi:MAG: protease modulator HflK [Verrucomicrobiota bacterium]